VENQWLASQFSPGSSPHRSPMREDVHCDYNPTELGERSLVTTTGTISRLRINQSQSTRPSINRLASMNDLSHNLESDNRKRGSRWLTSIITDSVGPRDFKQIKLIEKSNLAWSTRKTLACVNQRVPLSYKHSHPRC